MTIQPYNTFQKQLFIHVLADYFEELDCTIPREIVTGKLADLILAEWSSGVLRIDLAGKDDRCIGFSIYQVDTAESDWCKRPGWGFIREFYVAPEYRNEGIGKTLALHTEAELCAMDVKGLYLTSDDTIPFWRKCGWRLTKEVCSNGSYILEK